MIGIVTGTTVIKEREPSDRTTVIKKENEDGTRTKTIIHDRDSVEWHSRDNRGLFWLILSRRRLCNGRILFSLETLRRLS